MTTTKKMVVAGALMIAFVFSSGTEKARAQESQSSSTSGSTGANSAGSSSTKSAEQRAPIPSSAYRLDYSINELEDGKKINTRRYSVNVNENDSNELKIGTRVPVEAKQGEVEYIDVGTKIDGRTQTAHDGQLKVFVHAEMSSFAMPEQADGHDQHPVIRQLRIGGSTVVVLDKPMLMGVVDDPNSKRQFQLELTVTKLR